MHRSLFLIAVPALLAACSSGDGGHANAGTPSETKPDPTATGTPDAAPPSNHGEFVPPPVEPGYTRLLSPTVKGVEPGAVVTFCQYVMAPLDHDVDIMGVKGFQTEFGHHAVAFTYAPQPDEELGSSFPCMGTEFSGPGSSSSGSLAMGAFLGAAGGEGPDAPTSASTLPEGVAFRLKKGSGIMLNVHYLNTGTETIDGNAVLDVKMEDASPTRTIASMFVNLNVGFDIPPSGQATSKVDCVAKSDLKFIMFTNHMHEFGTTAKTEIIRKDGAPTDTLHEDNRWDYEMQFNPVYSHYATNEPLTVHAGDTIRTTCNWKNSTANALAFPREMCVGVGFALTTGENPTVPMCAQGTWIASGL